MKVSQKHERFEPRLAVVLYDLSVWFFGRTNRFPKNYRVTLGDRVDGVLLDMLTIVQRLPYVEDRRLALNELNMELNVLRVLVRLCVDLKCLEVRQYEYAAEQMEDIGKQVGGWLRSLNKAR